MLLYKSREASTDASAVQRQQWIVTTYFIALLLLGLFIYKDYGVSWDESIDRVNGLVNAKYILGLVAPDWTAQQYIFANVPEFHSHSEIDHGVLFHLPLAFLEVFSGGIDSRTYYLVRHFCIFLSFMTGAWALYKLGCIRFRSWQLGLLGSLMLVLSPRLFADAFYNGKDLVFTAFFTLAIYTLVRLLQQPTLGKAVVHGLATAAATDMRILGCMLVALSLGMLVLEFLFVTAEDKARRRALVQTLLVYGVATFAFTVLLWPYLWESPIHNFLQAFDNMRRFRWEGEMLYMGGVIKGTELPWHYIPVWLIVSTPVFYTLAFVGGGLTFLYVLLRRGIGAFRTFAGRLDLLFSGWFILPILMVILLHSVIYDGWRHMYFVYPAFLLLALRGIQAVWQAALPSPVLRRVVLGLAVLAGVEGVITLGRMVAAHPNQQVYYSFLSASEAERLFERDYWGVSFKQGLEWVLANDNAGTIAVDCGQFPILLENNIAILKQEDRQRLQINATEKNRYFFASYRTHPEAYPDSLGIEAHKVQAYGIKILSVYHHW